VLTKHVYAEPPPLVPLAPLPGHVLDLCARCLRKNPAERPSAREVTRLLAHAAGLDIEDAPPASRPGAEVPAEPSMIIRPPRRRWGRWAVGAVPVIVAAALIGWFVAHDGPGRSPGAGSRVAEAPPSSATGPAPDRRDASPGAGATPGRPGVVPTAGARGQSAAAAATGTAVPTATPAPTGTFTTTPPVAATTPPPGATTAAPTSAAPTVPVVRTFSSAGGTVDADCPDATTARILTWKAARTYRVEAVDTEPGPAPAASFRHGSTVVTMTITCADGLPSARTT
jgi:eukaryotic-like serine/threonine-protein kinase